MGRDGIGKLLVSLYRNHHYPESLVHSLTHRQLGLASSAVRPVKVGKRHQSAFFAGDGFCLANVTRTRPFIFRVPIFFTTQGASLTLMVAPTVSLLASGHGRSKFMVVRFRGINPSFLMCQHPWAHTGSRSRAILRCWLIASSVIFLRRNFVRSSFSVRPNQRKTRANASGLEPTATNFSGAL